MLTKFRAETPKGKWPLPRLTLRWEDNSRMDFKEMAWRARIGLIWLRRGTDNVLFLHAVMTNQARFSRRTLHRRVTMTAR
jgi:hypothetical protein